MSEVTVTLDELRQLVDRIGKRLPQVAGVAMRASMAAMVRDVARNRMSGQYLGVVTGTARRSIGRDVVVRSDRIVGRFGSPLRYVRAHEEGYRGPVQVRAHQRRIRRLQTGRGGQVTQASAKRYKKRRGTTTAHVRAHTRQVNMRARRFIRDTLFQETGQLPALLSGGGAAPFTRRMVKAMRIFVEQERMPRVGELGLLDG